MTRAFKTLQIEKKEAIAFIQLNRPKKLNALSNEVLEELAVAANWLDEEFSQPDSSIKKFRNR